MYLKCLLLAPIGWLSILVGLLLAPILPLFARKEFGLCDNGEATRFEPRLTTWLSWFQTPDNSLYGDAGWRTTHCPNHWHDYIGMVGWLLRNPAYGFAWNVLAVTPPLHSPITTIGDVTVNDGANGHAGWYLSRTVGAFRFRWIVQTIKGRCAMLDLGWCMAHDGVTKGNKLLFYGINPRFPKLGN